MKTCHFTLLFFNARELDSARIVDNLVPSAVSSFGALATPVGAA